MVSLRLRASLFAIIVCGLSVLSANNLQAQVATKTTLKVDAATGKAQLLRDGKPYTIKGVGGNTHLQLLAQCGGNSIRTWDSDNVGPILDEAHKLGLSVTVGVWLGHERHGFKYTDAEQIAQQIEKVRKTVLTYRNHPAVLMWALGNEMEGYANGDNAAIWMAIDHLAVLCKELDPNHPTMSVIAEIGGDKVKNFHRFCPHVDVLGINSYQGAFTIPERYKNLKGTKPYVVTEFGPAGMWETTKTSWEAPIEATSTEKQAVYEKAYRATVIGDADHCLGSYAFVWGNKQEATATWFGLLLPTGEKMPAVDTLSQFWTGKPLKNLSPKIDSLMLSTDFKTAIDPGTKLTAKLVTSDPEKDKLTVKWVIQQEADSYGTGGDAEAVPDEIAKAIIASSNEEVTFTAPAGGGGYRVLAYVYDGAGGAATANIPFLVKGKPQLALGKTAKLPLVIFAEGKADKPTYVPSGWMGNTDAMKLSEACTTQPHTGETCIQLSYNQPQGWGGIVWQHPANDWGNSAGGFNLQGAKALKFWARGEKGGEKVSIQLGLYGKDKKYFDTATAKLDSITLSKDWQEFSLPVEGLDLSRIKSGMAIVFPGDAGPQTLFLDDIRYE